MLYIIFITLLLLFCVITVYSLIHTYKIFKNTNYKIVSTFKRKLYSYKYLLFIKIFPLAFLLIASIISVFIFNEIPSYITFLPVLLFLPNTYNYALLINDSYISTMLYNIPTKNLDYILIEKPNYNSSNIVFHTNNNHKYRSIVVSNTNIKYIVATLREFGYEVHITP
ncbi:hypothetical protein UC77_01365 [Clostridium baratii]|nr:hypothetical protein UC77_01365 [Clostridium baratii]